MIKYELSGDISYVIDNNKLIILDFNSGDYFIVEGICMDIIQFIDKSPQTEDQLIFLLEKKYNKDEYDIKTSLVEALKSLKMMNIIS